MQLIVEKKMENDASHVTFIDFQSKLLKVTLILKYFWENWML